MLEVGRASSIHMRIFEAWSAFNVTHTNKNNYNNDIQAFTLQEDR